MKNKLEKIIEYGIYLFLFILPWQTRWIIKEAKIEEGYFEYGSYSLYGSDILLLSLLVLATVYFLKKKPIFKNKEIKKFWYAIAVLDLASLISIFVASDHYLALYKYAYLLLGIGLFSLIIYFPYKRSKAVFSFAFALFIQSVFAVVQFLLSFSPDNKWLGLANHDPINLGVSVVEGMGSLGYVERWLRSHAALDHPNMLGGFLTMGLFVIIFTLIGKSKAISLSGEDDYRRKIFKMNIVFYPLILLLITGIFFSFSRAAWLASFTLLILILFISVIGKDKLTQKYFLPIFLYSGIIIFLVSIPFGNLIEARFKGQGRLEYISKAERITSVYQAKDVLTDNYLLGTGIGNYTIEIKNNYEPDKASYYYQPTHNTFLLVASEIGVLGLLALLIFIIFVFFEGLNKNNLIYKLPWLSAFSVLLFFDHRWWSLHFGVLSFWLICGLGIVCFRVYRNRSNMV